MSSKTRPTYEWGPLEAWTRPQQAALYKIQEAKQKEADYAKKFEEKEKKEQEKKDYEEKKGEKFWKQEAVKVEAGVLVDDLIKYWNPPIFQFLDRLGPPHLLILPFVIGHVAYWLMAPWYLRFLTFHTLIYIIPGYCGIVSILRDSNRLLWFCYFFELATMEYFEYLLYRDRGRSLLLWPKFKAILCFMLYTAIKLNPKKQPLYGAVELLKWIIPRPASSSSSSGSSRPSGSGSGRLR